MIESPKLPISGMELSEFLMASTSADIAHRLSQEAREKGVAYPLDKMRDHIRDAMRLQRFGVMNWLMMNGVSIPVELMADTAHPQVGKQMPDRSPGATEI